MTATATLTSKGQITIPVEVRSALGLAAGDKLDFLPSAEGWIIRPRVTSLASLRGALQHAGPAVSIEEMNEAIAKAACR